MKIPSAALARGSCSACRNGHGESMLTAAPEVDVVRLYFSEESDRTRWFFSLCHECCGRIDTALGIASPGAEGSPLVGAGAAPSGTPAPCTCTPTLRETGMYQMTVHAGHCARVGGKPAKGREPGCKCHREEGDSECPVHDAPTPPDTTTSRPKESACKAWCGMPETSHAEIKGDGVHWGAGSGTCWCSEACRDAGHPAPGTATAKGKP